MLKSFLILFITVLVFIANGFSQSNNSGVQLYSQIAPLSSPIIWSQDFGPGNEGMDTQIADDFLCTGSWSIDQIVVMGAFEDDGIIASGFNVYFYSDNDNKPADLVYFGAVQPFTQNSYSGTSILFTITLETPAELSTGTYWISLQACLFWPPAWEFWYWNQISSNVNRMAEFQNPGGATSCTNWTPIQSCYSVALTDQYFELYGSLVVPVELTSFSANFINSNVELTWITSTETNNKGFEILRSAQNDSESWERIGLVDGHGTTTETQAYSFTDKNVVSGKYKYRLKQIDYDGTFEYSNVVEVEVTSPSTYSLEQNYPNPFNPSTKISWQSPASSHQTLKVYDLLGREVATLFDDYKPAGRYEVEFDASHLSSGVYLYKLSTVDFTSTKKLILLK